MVSGFWVLQKRCSPCRMLDSDDKWKLKWVALIRLVSKIILTSVPNATEFQTRLKIDDTHKKFANLDDKKKK